MLHLESLCPNFKDFVLEDIPLRLIYSISKYQSSYKTSIEFIKEKCYVHNIFTINLWWFVVIGFNLISY